MVAYNKRVKRTKEPQTGASHKENPNAFYSKNPSWRFCRCDKERWQLFSDDAKDSCWNNVFPRLKDLEGRTWQEILVQDKVNNHPLVLEDLNKCARDRLVELNIEAESIVSLRVNATHRLYGYIVESVFFIIWYDTEHGDNDYCVCRSHKKHS